MTEHMPEHDPSYGIPDIAEPAGWMPTSLSVC